MKKKILSTIISAVCALATIAAFTVKTPVAKAEVNKENYVLNSFSDSFTTSNCDFSKYATTYTAFKNDETTVFKQYNGYNAKFNGVGSSVEYKKAVDVTDNTGSDVIFEFIPAVEKQGTREFYKFSVYLTDEQDENKYIKLEFKANQQYYTFINASAKDGDKEFKPASKYQGAYYSDADNDRGKGFQTGFGTSGYGGTQSFQSYRIYWDNAKKTIEVGASREGNTVVRDFSIPDGELGIDGYTGNDAFGGFTSGKVKVRVEADNVLTPYANMTFISIDGEKFARPFGLAKKSETVEVGTEVTLPEITEAWDVKSGSPIDVSGLSPEIEVKNLGGIINLTDNNSFVASEKGVYTARYFLEQNGVTYCAEYEINAIECKSNSFKEEFTANADCTTAPYAATATLTNGNKVNGYHAQLNKSTAVVKTAKAIDVVGKTKNDILFEFLPQITEESIKSATGEETVEFQWLFLTLIISDAEDSTKYISLNFKGRKTDHYVAVTSTAKQGNVDFKKASYADNAYSSSDDYAFQTNGSFWTKNLNETVKLFWDNDTKCLYLSPARYSTLLRDFSKSDSELGINGYTGTEVFDGFTSGKVNVTLKAVRSELDFNVYLLSAGGESFARPFGMEEIDYIVKTGDEVALPAVTYGWNVASGKETTITASDYTVTVSCDGETVAVENGKFIPTKSGEYTITYKCTQDGVPYKTEQTIIARDFASEYSLFGAAIRINAADGNNGIRFYAKIKKGLYDELKNRNGFASGTLVIPEKNLGNAELTVDNESALKGDTTEQWYEDGEYMVSVVYLWNIPAANYGNDICARSYITVDGQTYYTEFGKWSMTYVAEYAYANYKDKVSKEKLAEYFGSTLTVTYQTESGEKISTEQVKFADVAKGVADEDGKKVKGYKIRVKGELVDFDITTEILADTTIIVCYE